VREKDTTEICDFKVIITEMAIVGKPRPGVFLRVALVALLVALGGGAVWSQEKEPVLRGEGCLGCHKGIETINAKMAAAWGADTRCEGCHYGQPEAATKLEAHAGLIANPSDFRVIDRTCARCHSDYGDLARVEANGVDNHVGRVLRSLMATSAGEIAGARYLWNEQNTRSALYGIRAVADLDQEHPEEAVPRLHELPPASGSDADSLLRACLRCHLWTEDKRTPGMFRTGGCAACHVLYSESGLSRSGDPTIPKDEPGHPAVHMITTAIPTLQCLWCHNDGGSRIGLSYIGLSVINAELGQGSALAGQKTAYGAAVIPTTPDIHYLRGMDCIDCHDTLDVHGDGNLYSHQEHAAGITCEDCHGSASAPPDFRGESGERLKHVDIIDDTPYLQAKLTLEMHRIPVIHSKEEGSDTPAIWHAGHGRLECYACHSASAPQCYVCHMVRDDARPNPVDWVRGIGECAGPQESSGSWAGRKLFQLWEAPVLGVNQKNRIAPFIPGGQAVLTHLDEEGETVKLNHSFTTAGGLYGFSLNPVQPHNVTRESRACSSCHSERRALGLGSEGFADLRRLGLSVAFPPDKCVDEEGNRIQDSAHEVRPFNREELIDLYRTGGCVQCHERPLEGAHPSALRPGSMTEADRRHHRAIGESVAPGRAATGETQKRNK
jgi:hypothetical protein